MKRLLVLSGVLIACGLGILVVFSRGRAQQTATQQASNSRGEPDVVYPTRGRIVMLPRADSRTSELQIHHEAIDTFVNPNGTVGMPSMTMPFPLGAGSTLEGIAVGDAVSFDFAAWTKPGSRHYEVRNLRKLPADTKLDLPN